MTIEGVKLGEENPLPSFSAAVQNRVLAHDGTFSKEDERLFGFQTGKKIFPYAEQDRFTRNIEELTVQTIILENDKLRAVFLPAYGARLYSLFDKKRKKDIVFKNEALIFGNLSQRNAWFSGGIEFNFGHYGHCALTCEPLFAARVENGDYSVLRFYEYERVSGVFCQMDFHLPDGADTLDLFVRMKAAEDKDIPAYWWTNTAVRQTEGCRVMSAGDQVIFTIPRRSDAPESEPAMGAGRMPHIRTFDGDCSYPAKINFSHEYFFQNSAEQIAWEAVGYEDGRLFFEVSTQPLRYRKMFCWGRHTGGRNWQQFLNRPKEEEYLEVQAGIAPTQLHGAILKAGEPIEFTQCFGEMQSPDGALELAWKDAAALAAKAVFAAVSPQALEERHKRNLEIADKPVSGILSAASGWGALEIARLAAERSRAADTGRDRADDMKRDRSADTERGESDDMEQGKSADAERGRADDIKRLREEGKAPWPGLLFPAESIGDKQRPWLELLEKGALPEHEPPRHADWMNADGWLRRLEDSLLHEKGAHWETFLHLGLMYRESGDGHKAEAMWKQSLQCKASAVVYRNLAQCYEQEGRREEAVSLMERALQLPGGQDVAYREEYLGLLILNGQHQKAWDYFHALDKEERSDRCEITLCEAALALDEFSWLEAFFQKEHPAIREGEYAATDAWRKWQEKMHGSARAKELKMPSRIDFRGFEG